MNLKERAEARKKEYYSHVSPKMKALAEREEPISLKEWNNLRSNSYERKLLYKNLSNEALIYLSNYCIDQTGGRLPDMMLASDYNEVVIRELAPLLADRLAEAGNNILDFEKLDLKENDIVLLKSNITSYDFLQDISSVLPKGVLVICIDNDQSFDKMTAQKIDDMLRLLLKQDSDIAKRLKDVLIRNVGDARRCWKCSQAVVIGDPLAKETYKLYKELFPRGKVDE